MFGKSKLRKALEQATQPGANLSDELYALSDYEITSRADAEAICDALVYWSEQPVTKNEESLLLSTPIHEVAGLFQQVASDKAAQVLHEKGLPILLRRFDRQLPAHDDAVADELLFLLKIFALYPSPPGLERIVQAARQPLRPESFMWSVIFGAFTVAHPLHAELIEALRAPLPAEFIGVTYLDLTNRAAHENQLPHHPFDTPSGYDQLRGWLIDINEETFSYAVSATANLPWLSQPARDELLALAQRHPELEIQLEAAWAQARAGDRAGIVTLQKHCLTPHLSQKAQHYLTELNAADAVPPAALAPEFQAMAEMCSWLAHPMELGSAPSELTQFDTREIYWPPTKDTRRVWLFKYRYDDSEDLTEESRTGLGMVGSITFALFGDTTIELSAEDAYALHCCWELQQLGDKRAPVERSIEAGRKLLGFKS